MMSLFDDKRKTLLHSLTKIFVGIDALHEASSQMQNKVSHQIEFDEPLKIDELENICELSQSLSDTLHDVRFEYEEMIWEMERQKNHNSK